MRKLIYILPHLSCHPYDLILCEVMIISPKFKENKTQKNTSMKKKCHSSIFGQRKHVNKHLFNVVYRQVNRELKLQDAIYNATQSKTCSIVFYTPNSRSLPLNSRSQHKNTNRSRLRFHCVTDYILQLKFPNVEKMPSRYQMSWFRDST